MRGKLISLLMVLAMVLSTIVPVHASTVNQEVELIAQNVKAITFKAANKYGVDILFTVPDEAPTETKVTLYNAADNSVVSGLATGTSISSTVTNPVTYTEGDYVTAGKRVLVCYYGLSNTATYYATIEMKNASKSGKVTVSDIKPTGYAADWDGFKFGRLYVEHRTWDASHDLVTTSIDTENVYSGESSLKIHSEGFHRNGLNTRDDINTAVAVNGVNFTSSYYEWKLAYKGKAPKSYECTNGTIKSTTTELDGDWTIVTMVIAVNASNTSIYPRIYFGNTFDATTYLDAMSLKKIDTYNDDGTYAITDNTNYLLGGGFETKVSNLRMDTEKVLTWSLEDGAYFAKLTIAKDGEVIDTIDGTTNSRGVQANSYTITDENWDINSTYTVTAATASGYSHAYHTPTASKEGEVVSVKGLSEIVIDNYNGAKPVDAIAINSGDGVIDVIWNMPTSSETVLRTTAELIDADGDTVESNIVIAQAGQKNVYTTFNVEDKTAKYSVKITAIYDDLSAGVATIDEVYADAEKTGDDVSGTNTFKGMVYGNWWAIAKSVNGRVVYDITYDTENTKTAPGSLKIDFRGAVITNSSTGVENFSDNHAGNYGNTYLLINNSASVEQDKYYELEYTYKSTPRSGFGNGVAMPGFMGGTDATKVIGNTADYVSIGTTTDTEGNAIDVYKLTTTDDNGWTTVKALYKATSNDSFFFSVINEWSARRILWIDSATLKEATYDETNKSYTVTGNNLFVGGDLDFEVKNAVMEDDNGIGIIMWEETYPEMVNKVRIYTTDGNFVDEVTGGTCFATVEDSSKEYILKVVTQNNTKVSTVETAGVTVAAAETEDVPEIEIGEISLDKNSTKATVSVTVKNNKRVSLPARLIIAEYEGNTFVKLISVGTTLAAGDPQETLSNELTLNKEGNTVKAFLFESYTSMKPLATSVER